MMTRVEIVVSSLGVKGVLMALLDLVYTRCVISSQVAEKLGIRLRKLRQPMAFFPVGWLNNRQSTSDLPDQASGV